MADAKGNNSKFLGGIAYSPDALVEPMLAEAKKALHSDESRFLGADSQHASASSEDFSIKKTLPQISGRRFTLEESKSLILSALEDFDENLGKTAKDILATAQYKNGADGLKSEAAFRNLPYDGTRQNTENPYLSKDYKLEAGKGSQWNIEAVPPGQCRLMRCLPAKSEQKQQGENAYDPANKNDHAVIEFQFDGTIHSVVYMAHEIGHAIADRYGQNAGMTHRDNPAHMPEIQAYLAQHIVADALKNHRDPEIADVAAKHFRATMMESVKELPENTDMVEGRPIPILTGLGLYSHLKTQDAETRQTVSEALLGGQGPKNINEVLATAGFETPQSLRQFAHSAIHSATGQHPEAKAAPPKPQNAGRP